MTDSIKTGAITRFEGENFFLSNFYTAPFTWRGVEWQSAEHAFQAAKGYHIVDAYVTTMTKYMDSVRDAATPGLAKKAGRGVRIDVDEWDQQKVWYMREIVHDKFCQVPGLAGMLINTGATMLVEGNDWNDTFWGRCLDKSSGKWVGFNTLGVILMEERGWWSRGERPGYEAQV